MGLPLEKKSVGPYSRYGALSLRECQHITSTSRTPSDLLLLQLEWPVWLGHCFQNLRIVLKELVVDTPEAGNELLAATTHAAVVPYVESEDVSREAIAVEVHCCCDLRASKANVLGPQWYLLLSRVANVACLRISMPLLQSC